ncbi:MFS transporter [Ktedonosporobacter rubrisoli]|uniref:MFS transporter n=1 Tax=Ktedonosporobacter rubrisoli TaxID=2509675 RepID=A0A4V0YYB8_KTERU|nr:MFS transporter [Ktedonosporobacter rubrisoli]QBD75671.1 MFS transporter [Ktedonosporobacter rubrisoli]
MSSSFSPDEFTPAAGEAQAPETPVAASETGVKSAATKPSTAKQAVGGLLRPFKVLNFSLLFGGQTISVIGNALYTVALPWLILNNGGSAQELGIVLAAYGIPRMGCMLMGGWLADRLRPRRVMLIADIVRAVLVGLLALLALQGHPTLWQLCAIAVPLGALGGAFMPASMSILPDILNDDDLQGGNALNMSSMQGANLLGSAVAGVIVAIFTAGVGLLIDAATFVISAVSLALMRMKSSAPGNKREAGAASAASPDEAQAQEAPVSFLSFLRSSQLIHVVLLIAVAGGFCLGGLIEVALPAFVHGPMHGSASDYGIILAGASAGALVGGIFAGMLGKLKYKGLTMLGSGLLVAVSFGLLPFAGVLGAAVCMLIGGLTNSITNVLLFTKIQLIVPRHLLGRMMGLITFGSFGMYPVSAALMGVLSNQFGPALLFPCSGLLLALVMLLAMTQKSLRES